MWKYIFHDFIYLILSNAIYCHRFIHVGPSLHYITFTIYSPTWALIWTVNLTKVLTKNYNFELLSPLKILFSSLSILSSKFIRFYSISNWILSFINFNFFTFFQCWGRWRHCSSELRDRRESTCSCRPKKCSLKKTKTYWLLSVLFSCSI